MIEANIPVLGFAAYSGTGKTTLLKKLLPRLNSDGLRVGVIKHTHHHFEIDQPGKDSYELRKAGANQMLLASGRRWALVVETHSEGDLPLQEMINQLDHSHLDLILVEGYKHEVFHKIELHRKVLGKPYIYPDDTNIIAVISDDELSKESSVPQLDFDDLDAIIRFILSWMRLQ